MNDILFGLTNRGSVLIEDLVNISFEVTLVDLGSLQIDLRSKFLGQCGGGLEPYNRLDPVKSSVSSLKQNDL